MCQIDSLLQNLNKEKQYFLLKYVKLIHSQKLKIKEKNNNLTYPPKQLTLFSPEIPNDYYSPLFPSATDEADDTPDDAEVEPEFELFLDEAVEEESKLQLP